MRDRRCTIERREERMSPHFYVTDTDRTFFINDRRQRDRTAVAILLLVKESSNIGIVHFDCQQAVFIVLE